MAALCAGSYGLSQQHQPQHANDHSNKELIFVKLTDSALKAIEEFQRNQLKFGTALNPSIQFANGQGYLSFPSGNGNNVQKFSFSISDIEGGGSMECIQQNQGQQLQNMGHIQHKMRIHANDDVYEKTRERMAAVEENQKNKCTREIKPNQTDIGRKVKLKNPTTRISNIPSSNSLLSKRDSLHSSSNNYSSSTTNNNNNSNHNNNINHHNGSSNAIAAAANNHSSSLMNPALANNHQHHNGNLLSSSAATANSTNSYSNHLSTSPKLPKSNGFVQQQHNNHHYSNGSSNNGNLPTAAAQLKPGYQHTVHDPPQQQQSQQKSESNGVVSSRTANGRTSHKGSSGNPDIMKRNIRERLIHMLALRPYKRPEIILKLQQDGVRKEERKCISQILTNISSMRDNVYSLHRHVWNDVQEDWPFYTEQERQILKRRKPQNLTPPGSDGGSSTSGQSPSSAHNGSSPPSGGKRPSIASNDDLGSMPTSKKPRISHYKKDILPDTNRSSVTPNAQESEDSGVSLSYSLVSNDVARRIQAPSSDKESRSERDRERERDRDRDRVEDVISERDNYDDQINAYRANTNKVKSLKDDFSDQFTRITSVEQRRKYKTEFDNDFQEYRRLHEIVERVSRKFAQLEENLQHERHNERRYKEIQRQIIKEYDESIKDNKFQETKQRFNYLHNKLSHIKHLVHDYDVAITNGHCRPQENY
ncbi:RNA polymerase II elongation factor Ell isoform X2 [Aedes aegypti]|uniref:OCEL domain-containing protein n=1 Tax=Aedes aegypti TaxID=7159 RepID=A0A6I8T8K6_AEDAE|nr:RNA polymerase II elongation factor Ell isoform X2 [Aedes aegypti]XP_021707773.1 RNA polymerase II elongation factor Ell isoform X2 [Aedes aegypti]XP_021707774.1 RNA polymerase II elongation factor Ell isoform X2 [Aedes aegypti]